MRLLEYEFDVHFLSNSIEGYRHFEIQISTSCITIESTAVTSRLFSYPKYFQTQKLGIHSLSESKESFNSFTNFFPVSGP